MRTTRDILPTLRTTTYQLVAALLAGLSLGALASVYAGEESAKKDEIPPRLERVRVTAKGDGFELVPSGERFTPIGFNYDHDDGGRLIEEYWVDEWERVVEDFGEMQKLGANVARVHLQLGRFLKEKDRPDEAALERLRALLALAERSRIYLDLTGLGCYLKEEVPAWYDELSESERWSVQEKFWESIATVGAKSPAVFCYDLMNEPVVPGGKRETGEWLGPPFAGKFHFVQFISLDVGERSRPEVAREWIRHLAAAIRRRDSDHLITVGLVPWSLDRPGLTSGFVPKEIAPELDFISVHLYPERGKIDDALETLAGFAVGKPVVIEETFPLQAGPAEHLDFLRRSQKTASGWIGFYWGKTPEECRRSGSFQDAFLLAWLEEFETFRGELEEGGAPKARSNAGRPEGPDGER